MGKTKHIAFVGIMIFLVVAVMSVFTAVPELAFAGVNIEVGDQQLNGWTPNEMVKTDVQVAPEQATAKLESIIVKLTKTLMPIVMIGCVAIIIYNAVRNIFKRKEDRVPMGDLIKNMFVQFFFILFAWIIVEGIVYLVTGGETLLFSTILS